MNDKTEATRLADVLDDSLCPMCHQAAALLRRWPDGEPVGYLPAYELDRLQNGHDGRLRSAKFGPSALDGDIALYTTPPAPIRNWDATLRAAARRTAEIVHPGKMVPPADQSERIAALERELANAYAEGRKDEREEWTAEFKPSGGGCTCAGPDGPCESCEANRAAYEEWLAERPWHARIAALEAALEQAREALEKSRRSEHNPFESDNQSEHYERLCAALRAIEGTMK